MPPIVECVPNFGEGRDLRKVGAIVEAIERVRGVWLLHVDSGASVNRTVVTFAGSPAAVVDGALAGIREATKQIDMRSQRGAHPCQGATDVCPFVPLSDASMDLCVALAKDLGRRVAQQLQIPVFLYAQAASRPERARLAPLRRGGFQALGPRMRVPEGQPDFGPPVPHASAGALITGARELLVAYNVNLDRPDVLLARRIASAVREESAVVGAGLKPVGLAGCRALGWVVEEFDRAQVTTNLTDYRRTGLHQAYQRVGELARSWGADVTGSEIVGLVPEAALLAAGAYYADGVDGPSPTPSGQADSDRLIGAAVRGLGLEDVRSFDPDAQILERALGRAMARGVSPRT